MRCFGFLYRIYIRNAKFRKKIKLKKFVLIQLRLFIINYNWLDNNSAMKIIKELINRY